MKRNPSLSFTLLVLLAALALSACGYSVRRPPVDSVRLGVIKNNTTEPKLEDRLYEALTTELMKNGIRVDSGSSHALEGTIDEITLRGTAEKDEVTVQYEVGINGSFFLVEQSGERKPLRKSNAFIVTFQSEGPLAEVVAFKERATITALRDMAAEIVTSIVNLR